MRNNRKLKVKSESLLMHLLKGPEAKFVDSLSRAFINEGVELNRNMIRQIIDFAQLVQQLTVYKRFKSKKISKDDLDFRIGTIKRLLKQTSLDEGYFHYLAADECIDSLLFVALIEKAYLINEAFKKNNFNEMHAVGFHLWAFKNNLVKQNISKPVNLLSSVLAKSGILEELDTSWSVKTIYNRCALTQTIINKSKELGACHAPTLIGKWPRLNSTFFVDSISQDCMKCREAWTKVLLVKSNQLPAIDQAAEELVKKLPQLADLTKSFVSSLRAENENGITLSELLNRLPVDMRAVLLHLF